MDLYGIPVLEVCLRELSRIGNVETYYEFFDTPILFGIVTIDRRSDWNGGQSTRNAI